MVLNCFAMREGRSQTVMWACRGGKTTANILVLDSSTSYSMGLSLDLNMTLVVTRALLQLWRLPHSSRFHSQLRSGSCPLMTTRMMRRLGCCSSRPWANSKFYLFLGTSARENWEEGGKGGIVTDNHICCRVVGGSGVSCSSTSRRDPNINGVSYEPTSV